MITHCLSQVEPPFTEIAHEEEEEEDIRHGRERHTALWMSLLREASGVETAPDLCRERTWRWHRTRMGGAARLRAFTCTVEIAMIVLKSEFLSNSSLF